MYNIKKCFFKICNLYDSINYYAATMYDQTFGRVVTGTRLRTAYNDADERVFIGARSLHGGIKASGKIKLRVLGTPYYNTQKGSQCRQENLSWIMYFMAREQYCHSVTYPE